MWIKVKDELVNLTNVKFVGLSQKPSGKCHLYFVQSEQTTVHIVFDSLVEAKSAMLAIEQCLEVKLQFP